MTALTCLHAELLMTALTCLHVELLMTALAHLHTALFMQAAAAEGDTAAPDAEEDTNLHFVTFVHHDGEKGTGWGGIRTLVLLGYL